MASLAVTTAHEFMYLHSPTLLGSGHPAEEEEEESSLVGTVPYPLGGLTPRYPRRMSRRDRSVRLILDDSLRWWRVDQEGDVRISKERRLYRCEKKGFHMNVPSNFGIRDSNPTIKFLLHYAVPQRSRMVQVVTFTNKTR